MSTVFFRYRRLTGLVVFLVVAAGMGALGAMGRQEDPYLTERFGRVIAAFPGADAERVEALIAEPLEAALMQVEEVDEVETIARANVAILSVSMREEIDADAVEAGWTKIRSEVAEVAGRLPEGAPPPEVEREYLGAASLIAALSWPEGSEAGDGALGRLARDLEDRLLALDGTYRTEIYGAPQEEVRVTLDPEAAAALGLSAQDVADALAAADAKAPAGRLAGSALDLTVEVEGGFASLDRVREVPLTTRSGGLIRLSDIAQVERAVREPAASEAYVDGAKSILVAAYIQPDRRVDLWNTGAQAILDDFAEATPGLIAEPIFAQAGYVDRRLNGLAGNLGLSALIVFAVLFLTMGWRAALILGAALPLTVLLVLFLIQLIGQPLNQMSVTGLVIALGLLIDNAIVTVDEYRLLRGKGRTRLEAVDQAARILFAPLAASTATTVFAFAPIALMPGVAGEFISMIGVSVIFAVVSSFALAFTVILAFAAWFDDPRASDPDAGFWRNGLRAWPLAWTYRRLLNAVIDQPWLGVALSLILPVAGFAAAVTLPSQFFPPTDRDMFETTLTLPAGASITRTRERAAEVSALLREHEGVEEIVWVIGNSAPRVYYNMRRGQSGRPNYAAGFVRTRSPEATRRIVTAFQAEAREAFPDAQILALPFEQGPPTPAPIELTLVGPELATLDRLGQDVRRVLAGTPGVTYAQAQLVMGAPAAMFTADEAAAAYAGLPLSAVAGRIRADLDGAAGGSVLEGVEALPVRVMGPPDRRERAGSVALTPLASGQGLATIGALGAVRLAPDTAGIARIDGERSNPIYGYLSPYVLPAGALATVFDRLEAEGVDLPPGYRLDVGGEAEGQSEATADLMSTALPLLVLMIGSVILAFNSLRYAAVIFLAGVLSVGLALFGVWLFNTPLGFNAIVGSMGLVGLSINGSIVVLSALKANPAAIAGDAEAIADTVMDATRHIVSTTLTTMGGFAPLLIEGDSFWMPFASAVAGGVAGSAVLALVFAPSCFVIGMRLRDRLAARPLPETAATA